MYVKKKNTVNLIESLQWFHVTELLASMYSDTPLPKGHSTGLASPGAIGGIAPPQIYF